VSYTLRGRIESRFVALLVVLAGAVPLALVEHGVPDALDGDPVLAADDGDVPDRDAARVDDDPAAHDRSRLAHKNLALGNHERPWMDTRGEMDDRGA